MQIWPAIDLYDGRCVRLVQGNYQQETIYGEDPVAMALRWESEGADFLHIVDLDGARSGQPVNRGVIRAIASATQLTLQVGGGIRDEDDANWGLSSLRADSARRALMEAGVPKSQIAQVIGMGDTAPLKPDDPGNEVNRRISITLLNRKSEETVRDRSGGEPQVEFIDSNNQAPGDARQPVINKAGSLLEELRKKRESKDNTYDNPPNKNEAFW